MNRQQATELLRKTLDENGLRDWHIRLSSDLRNAYLGLCSYKDRTIILHALHIDTHPEPEIKNTIFHEVAHALCPGMQHNDVWSAQARALGCDNTQPCSHLSFSDEAIDAIRSGASLSVEFTEETQVIRKPKYTISKLQDKCPTCGKVAKELSRFEISGTAFIFLECGHSISKSLDWKSNYDTLTFDGKQDCKHVWNKTVCVTCNAKRLYPYQVEGARLLEKNNGRFAIFDEMGLGKTIQAAAYLKFNLPTIKKFIWVTKSGIKYQHGKELMRILGDDLLIQVLSTGKDKLWPGAQCYIIGYDLFRRLDLEMFKDKGIGAIVLDECQAIKNPDSSRTQSLRTVIREIPQVIPLSGTPWKNRGSELFVALNLLDPKKFWSYDGFKRRYVDTIYGPNGETKEGGIVNPEKFREECAHIFVRRERKEVMPELPDVNRTKLFCQVPDYARKAYNAEVTKLKGLLKDAAIDGQEDSFATKAAVMQSLIIMRQIVGIAKVPSAVEFVQEFLEENDRKICIGVHHIKCQEMFEEQLLPICKELGYELFSLTSDLDSMQRFQIAERFNAAPKAVLIGSTLSMGEGLNLQTCSDFLLHERQWNPANEMQFEGRFARIGQKAESINGTYVLGDKTVDTILDGIVETKRIAFDNTMNKDGYQVQWNESSIIKELTNQLLAS